MAAFIFIKVDIIYETANTLPAGYKIIEYFSNFSVGLGGIILAY